MKQFYYRYLAFVYAFTHQTNRRRFLGLAVSSWIKLLALAGLLLVWTERWGQGFLLLAVIGVAWLYLVNWTSRRAGYVKFVADPAADPLPSEPAPLPADERVQIWATGKFIVRDDSDYTLLRPAEYWQVPLGDHIVMVKSSSERFAYQFFDAASLLEVRPGCLLFGSMLYNTLKVTILETRQAIAPTQFNFANPDKIDELTSKKRILYFTFADEENMHIVWRNLAHDAQRIRS